MTDAEDQGDRTPAGGPPPRGTPEPRDAGDPEEISLVRMVNVVLRHRRAIAGAAVTAALVLVAYTLVVPADYTSRAAFAPQTGDISASQLAGLAAQIGMSVPSGEGARSPQFYVDLLNTRKLLASTVRSDYRVPRQGEESRTGDLMYFLEVDEDEPPVKRLEIAVEKLRERTTTSANPETGVVSVTVTTRWPALSKQVVERMLELVNRFNVQARQSQASEEREFLEERVAQAQRDLTAAEDSLRDFLENNRSYENSPALQFEYNRLQRRVTLQQQVYTSLMQSFEQARIEEVRNTPVVTLVDPAEEPGRPDRRSLVLRGVLGLLLGGAGGTTWAFGQQFVSSARHHEPDEYAELSRLRREAGQDLRTLTAWATGPLRKLFGRRRDG